MSEEDPPDEGPVTDPQELERVMLLAMREREGTGDRERGTD
jgi:hypothetical protein